MKFEPLYPIVGPVIVEGVYEPRSHVGFAPLPGDTIAQLHNELDSKSHAIMSSKVHKTGGGAGVNAWGNTVMLLMLLFGGVTLTVKRTAAAALPSDRTRDTGPYVPAASMRGCVVILGNKASSALDNVPVPPAAVNSWHATGHARAAPSMWQYT